MDYSVLVKYFPVGVLWSTKPASRRHIHLPVRSLHLFSPPLPFLCTLSLCQVNFPSPCLCLARPHLISPSHFVFYVHLPSSFSSRKLPEMLFFSWSMASRLLLLFISGFFCLSFLLSPTLTSLCEFCTEYSLVLFVKITPTARSFHVGFLVLGVGRICK